MNFRDFITNESAQDGILDFGKHKGSHVTELEDGYLNWGAERLTNQWKALFSVEKDRRGRQSEIQAMIRRGEKPLPRKPTGTDRERGPGKVPTRPQWNPKSGREETHWKMDARTVKKFDRDMPPMEYRVASTDRWRHAREVGLRWLKGQPQVRLKGEQFRQFKSEILKATENLDGVRETFSAAYGTFEAVPPLPELQGWACFFSPYYDGGFIEAWTKIGQKLYAPEAAIKAENANKNDQSIEKLEDEVFSSKTSGHEFDQLVDKWLEARRVWKRDGQEKLGDVIRKRIAHLSAQATSAATPGDGNPSSSSGPRVRPTS